MKKVLLAIVLLVSSASATNITSVATAVTSSGAVSSQGISIPSVPAGNNIVVVWICKPLGLTSSATCAGAPTDNNGCPYYRTGAQVVGSGQGGNPGGTVRGLFICHNSVGGGVAITGSMISGVAVMQLHAFSIDGPIAKLELSSDHNAAEETQCCLPPNSLNTLVYAEAGDLIINWVSLGYSSGETITTPDSFTQVSTINDNVNLLSSVFYQTALTSGYYPVIATHPLGNNAISTGTEVLRASPPPATGFQQAAVSFAQGVTSSNTATLPSSTTAGSLLQVMASAFNDGAFSCSSLISVPTGISDGHNTWTLVWSGSNLGPPPNQFGSPNAALYQAVSVGGSYPVTVTWGESCDHIITIAEYGQITNFTIIQSAYQGSYVVPTLVQSQIGTTQTSQIVTWANGFIGNYCEMHLTALPADTWIQRRWDMTNATTQGGTGIFLNDVVANPGCANLSLNGPTVSCGVGGNGLKYSNMPIEGNPIFSIAAIAKPHSFSWKGKTNPPCEFCVTSGKFLKP